MHPIYISKATDISEEFRLDEDSPLIFYSSCKDGDNEDETRLRTDEGDGSFSGGHRRADRIPDSGILHQGVQEPLRRNTGGTMHPEYANSKWRFACTKRHYPNRQGEVKSFFRQGCAENDWNSRNFFLFLHVVGKTENILTELKGNNTNN